MVRGDSNPPPLARTYPAHAWRPKSWKLRRSRRRLRKVGDGMAKKTGEEGGERGRRGARGTGGSGRNASSSAAAAAGKAASCSSGMRPRPRGRAITTGGAGRPRLGGRWGAAPPASPGQPTQAGRPALGPTGPTPPGCLGPSGFALGPPLGRSGPGAPTRLRRDTPQTAGAPAIPLRSLQPPEASLQTSGVPPKSLGCFHKPLWLSQTSMASLKSLRCPHNSRECPNYP